MVPLNVLLTERKIAYHLEDSAAVAYFCFEDTAELPMGESGRAAFGPSPDASTSPSSSPLTLSRLQG